MISSHEAAVGCCKRQQAPPGEGRGMIRQRRSKKGRLEVGRSRGDEEGAPETL